MKNEFLSYQIALDMKSIGFDEPCFGYYVPLLDDTQELEIKLIETNGNRIIIAPIYRQVFKWFREKYNIQCSINFYSESLGVKKVPNHYEIQIDYLSNNRWCYFENIDNKIYLTYEEAELECLKKLIELCKKN